MNMKKIFPFFVLTSFLCACAGNPPAWWNPNNRYGSVDDTATSAVVQQAPQKPAEPTEEEMDSLPDTTYEEVTLTPMPDEENENTTGAASAQNEENLPQPSVLE